MFPAIEIAAKKAQSLPSGRLESKILVPLGGTLGSPSCDLSRWGGMTFLLMWSLVITSTITAHADSTRVTQPSTSMNKFARAIWRDPSSARRADSLRPAGKDTAWSTTLDARPGDTLEFKIHWVSDGDSAEFTLDIVDPDYSGFTIVPNSTTINGVRKQDPKSENGRLLFHQDGLHNPIELNIVYRAVAQKIVREAKFHSATQFSKSKK